MPPYCDCSSPPFNFCCFWASTTWIPANGNTPRWVIPNTLDSVPFWVWIVVACGALLLLIIIIFILVLCCCKHRTCFWCCCEGFDSESQSPIVEKETGADRISGRSGPQILYRYPDDDASDYGYASSRMAANDSYVPRAQRLTSGHQQITRIEELEDNDFDGRRSTFGGTMSSSYRGKPAAELAVVKFGGSASATAPQTGCANSAIGYHSAAIQVKGGGVGGVQRGPTVTTCSSPSIYPAI